MGDMFNKPETPPPPDYRGAAIEQGQSNLATARAQAKLSNPNVISPTGTQSVTYGGGPPVFDQGRYDEAVRIYDKARQAYEASLNQGGATGLFTRFGAAQNRVTPPAAPNPKDYYHQEGDPDVPTLEQTLSPEEQAIYEQGRETRGILSDVGTQGAESLEGIVGVPVDYSSAPAAPSGATETRNKVYDAMMSRINEETDRRRGLTQSDLIARGIPSGSEAYGDEMYAIDRGLNDARQQAILASGEEAERDFGIDTQARRNSIAEILSKRQTPLNEINALMSGSQVANPFAMPGYAPTGNIAPAPLYGAATQAGDYATDVYNADVGSSNAQMQGLMQLGSMVAMMMMFSDIRLKSNIERIGTHPIGVGIYEYDIFGRRETGVMAQELLGAKPEAVFSHPSGYLMVDYGSL